MYAEACSYYCNAMSIVDMVSQASPHPSPLIDQKYICFTEKGKKERGK